jgi:hypothetical protein
VARTLRAADEDPLNARGSGKDSGQILAAILNRVNLPGWKAEIASPTPTVTSMNGVRVERQKPKGPVNVVIASSGLKIFGAGEWLHEKRGGKPRRSWRRLHLAVDPDSSEILAAELTTTDEGDAFRVGPLLDQIDGPASAVPGDRWMTSGAPSSCTTPPPRKAATGFS